MGVGYYLKPVPATRTSIGPYVSLLHRISSLGSRGREKERGGDDRRGGKKSASKGIFIEWILKLMVATSDMLIRRASGFLITPDDGPRNNRRVIQIEDAPPARLLMRFTYVHPRFVSPPPSVCLSFFPREWRRGRRSHFVKTARANRPPRGNRYSCLCFLLYNPRLSSRGNSKTEGVIGGGERRM